MNTHKTLHTMLKDKSLVDAIAEVEAQIRSNPDDAQPRWLLVQLLCVVGDWQRAQKLLASAAPAVAPGKAGAMAVEQQYTQLMQAEQVREAVFAGTQAPVFVDDAQQPEWVLQLVQALACEGVGDQAAADAAREAALAQAPSVAGQCDQGAFAWLADADSRLGPVCEFVRHGQYFWVPLDRVVSLHMQEPARVLDFVWRPVRMVLQGGAAWQGHMPARYPGSEHGRDAVRLGRETLWKEQGQTRVAGMGQKMWMSDVGEWGLSDMRDCSFAAELAPELTPTQTPAPDGEAI